MGTLQDLENEVEKYFPYFNGYDTERKLPEAGQVILTLLQSGFVKVITCEEGNINQMYRVVRWWPLLLTQIGEGLYQRKE